MKTQLEKFRDLFARRETFDSYTQEQLNQYERLLNEGSALNNLKSDAGFKAFVTRMREECKNLIATELQKLNTQESGRIVTLIQMLSLLDTKSREATIQEIIDTLVPNP